MAPSTDRPTLRILGCRGIPAAHGGFETFAERLSQFLVARGWRVIVYCQADRRTMSARVETDKWNGVERVLIGVSAQGALGTIEFDLHATLHAAGRPGLCLVLGYNTGLLLAWLRLHGKRVLTNMDGIEWKRGKWSFPVRAWFYVNERLAAWLSTRLVADHPAIADHLATRRSREAIVTIGYGGDPVLNAPSEPVWRLGLQPGRYLTSIARIEPENNILSMVRAFSRRPRGIKLVVLGAFDDRIAYHREVKAAASEEVVFPGAIYDRDLLHALRFHALAHCHGHTVGGTNPSLVEALWAGAAIIAHDNVYNAWTAGRDQFFFTTEDEFDGLVERVKTDWLGLERARHAARLRAEFAFRWEDVLQDYETELLDLSGYARPRRADPVKAPPSVRAFAKGG